MAKAHRFTACPFCGAQEGFAFENNGDLNHRKFWVVCDAGCLSEGPIGASEDEAVAAWNRRAPVSAAP